jgi:5-oxoprolinase (ATP-hydrolysing) subunit A
MDLNCDLGESFGRWRLADDDALLGLVTSANVACGFHAGDPLTMLHVLEVAVARGVAIGAHVSYRDLAGFGRRYVAASEAELRGDVLYQLAALAGMAATVGGRFAYVKPHGALYNRIVSDEAHARAVVDAVTAFDSTLPVLGLPGSAVLRLARGAGVPTATEAFADRGYEPDGTLLPRGGAGAVLTGPAAVAARAVRMATAQEVEAAGGVVLPVHADSICVHSDTDGALPVLRAVRAALDAAGVRLAPFAPLAV